MQAFQVKNPAFEANIRQKLEGQHFMHHVGFDLTSISPGRVEGEMELKKIHKQQFGFVHGGVTATLMDITMGFAAYTLMPKGKGVVTANLSIDFLNPGDGEKIIAIGQVEKPGSKMVFCTAKIFTEKSGIRRHIGSARSVMAVVDSTPTQK